MTYVLLLATLLFQEDPVRDARSLVEEGKSLEALQLLEAALEPSNTAVHLNLASAYAALGNDAAEEAAMERYHELTKRQCSK